MIMTGAYMRMSKPTIDLIYRIVTECEPSEAVAVLVPVLAEINGDLHLDLKHTPKGAVLCAVEKLAGYIDRDNERDVPRGEEFQYSKYNPHGYMSR